MKAKDRLREALPFSQHPESRTLVRALQPQVRLELHGPSGLTHRELLAIICGPYRGGADGEHAPGLSVAGGFEALAQRSFADWSASSGIGRAAAARLTAAFELRRRASVAGLQPPIRIDGPRAAWRLVRRIGRARREHLVGVYLNAQNDVIHRETLSIGSLNTTRTHPREILYPAVRHLALAFLLAHNHPSGCLDPSSEDVDFTHSIRRAAELFGIELYDHLIVTANGFTSLRERGLL